MWRMKSKDNNFKDDILSKSFFLGKNGNDDIQKALTTKVGDFLPKCVNMNMNTSNVMTWRPQMVIKLVKRLNRNHQNLPLMRKTS